MWVRVRKSETDREREGWREGEGMEKEREGGREREGGVQMLFIKAKLL